VRKKQRAWASVPDDVKKAFLPHTLQELAGLLDEIGAVDDDDARKLMAVAFSAILTKVSLKKGDTDAHGQPSKRVARFFPSEVFQEKAHELLERQHRLFLRVGLDVPRPRFVVGDARDLSKIVERTALIVTSPPYAGTYDYARHHVHRLAFLGLDASGLQRLEIGARRRQNTRRAFDDDVAGMLAAMSSVLDPRGLAILLMGDGVLEARRVAADEHIARLCGAAGLDVVATAAAPRTDWRGGPDRQEHLIALRRR
jgi:hypothetical protein